MEIIVVGIVAIYAGAQWRFQDPGDSLVITACAVIIFLWAILLFRIGLALV